MGTSHRCSSPARYGLGPLPGRQDLPPLSVQQEQASRLLWCHPTVRERRVVASVQSRSARPRRTGGGPRRWRISLAEQGLISSSRRAKSAYLTEDGVEQARQLLARFGISSQ